LAEGKSGQEIATRLSVSPNTVRSHIQNIRAKLNVRSRLEAVTYAIRHGLGGGPTESYENETSR
jgi:DNA-binding CsgD family transcriptional regulator